MLTEIKITGLYRTDKDKQGNPLINSRGGHYTRLLLKASEQYPNYSGWISGFGNEINKNWKIGDVVKVILTEKEYNGQIYLNFATPEKVDLFEERLSVLELQMKALLSRPAANKSETPKAGPEFVEEELVDDINPEDLPFS